MKIKIDFETAEKNHMRADAERALKTFLNGDVGTSLLLFPQALNPFLKTLESLGIWRQAIVIPVSVSDGINKNKPAYMIVKNLVGETLVSVETEKLN